jgi:signal transduction histidine kinase
MLVSTSDNAPPTGVAGSGTHSQLRELRPPAAFSAATASEAMSSNARRASSADPLGLTRMATAARELMDARTPEAAASAVARWCARSLAAPVAVWLDGGEGAAALAAFAAPGSRDLSVERALTRISARGALSSGGAGPHDAARCGPSATVLDAFASAVGGTSLEVARARAVTLVVAPERCDIGVREAAYAAAELLADALEHLDEVARAERRNAGLERSLAWTAHELRGPLLGVRAAVGTALTLGGGASARRLLREAHAELEAAVGLIGPLLRFAAGDQPLRFRRTDLGRIARQAVTSVRRETGRPTVHVVSDERVPVSGAARHLRSAIANVVRNAVAYSPSDSVVTVEVRHHHGRASVRVADMGPGIDPRERSSVFDPFVRGSAGGDDRAGRGLGLFIAKRVVEAHGGRIWIESPGRGAVVHIELPSLREEAA